MRLTPAEVSALAGGKDVKTLTRLEAKGKGIEQVLDLDVCTSLKGLNLSQNNLTNATFLTDMRKLVWLNLTENQLTSLDGVQDLSQLKVLNAARNKLTSFAPVANLKELNALVLNDNELREVGNMKELGKLNTLVISRNQVEDLGQSLRSLLELTKLSCSHNKIISLGRSLRRNTMLSQLRISHNKLQILPPELSANGQLKLLDIGHNQIKNMKSLEVLQELPNLETLTVAGNPLCDNENYWEELVAFLPQIEKLDDRVIPGRGKIKRTAKIHLEGGFGSKVGEKIRKKAATFRREKKLVKEKHNGANNDKGSDHDTKAGPDRKAKAETDDSKAEHSRKRQKLNDGEKAVKEEKRKEAEKHIEIAAGEGDAAKTKGGTGVVKVWDRQAQTSKSAQESKGAQVMQQLLQTSVGLGSGNAWDDEDDVFPVSPQHVNTGGGTSNEVPDGTGGEDQPKPKYSRWALKRK